MENRRRRPYRFAVLAALSFGVGCSTPTYTRTDGIEDLAAETGLTAKQSVCVLERLERHYRDTYRSEQEELGITDVNPEAMEVFVKNELAEDEEPDPVEIEVFDAAVRQCTQ